MVPVSFTIGFDYDDDAQKACSFLKDRIQKVENVLPDPPCIASISGFTPAFVELKLYYWIDTFNKKVDYWHVKSAVMDECRLALKENGYTFSSNVETANTLKVTNPVEVINTKK